MDSGFFGWSPETGACVIVSRVESCLQPGTGSRRVGLRFIRGSLRLCCHPVYSRIADILGRASGAPGIGCAVPILALMGRFPGMEGRDSGKVVPRLLLRGEKNRSFWMQQTEMRLLQLDLLRSYEPEPLVGARARPAITGRLSSDAESVDARHTPGG